MNLRELQIFRAIMRGGSITEAARILGISQPAVSTALRYAEDQLGMPLFRRERGRIEPTPEALSLFPEVETLFQKFHAIQQYAEDLRGAHSGLLSLASPPTLSYAYLAPVVSRFRQTRPNVRVVVEVTNTRRIVELASTRQIDLGIIAVPFKEANIRTEDLASAEMLVVMRKKHPLAKRRVVKPQDLQRYPIITNTHHALFHVLEQTFRQSGVDLNIAIAANHHVTTCLLLGDSDAVGIVDPWMPRDLFPELVRKPFRPKVEIRARLLWASSRPMSRLAEAFVRELREHIGGAPNGGASNKVASHP
jgi:DNA-binding transcriptional LysR family regulator